MAMKLYTSDPRKSPYFELANMTDNIPHNDDGKIPYLVISPVFSAWGVCSLDISRMQQRCTYGFEGVE